MHDQLPCGFIECVEHTARYLKLLYHKRHFLCFKMRFEKAEFLIVYPAICFGVVSHLLLLVCLAKDPLKCFRNSASYLVTNLALADFIVCTAGMLETTFVYKFTTVLQNILTAVAWVSLFSIFLIAIDRYMLTVHPFTHRVLLNERRIAIWIASNWLFSLSLLAKSFVFDNEKVHSIIFHTIFITFAVLTGLIYLITYFSLRKQGRDISQQRDSRNQSLQKDFLKTITIVAFIQILTLVPENIRGLMHGLSLGGDSSFTEVILFQIYCLNFAINPFLYFWRLKNYRRTFCLVICRKAQ